MTENITMCITHLVSWEGDAKELCVNLLTSKDLTRIISEPTAPCVSDGIALKKLKNASSLIRFQSKKGFHESLLLYLFIIFLFKLN